MENSESVDAIKGSEKYKRMYHHLFEKISDALVLLHVHAQNVDIFPRLTKLLEDAQQGAEDIYISSSNKKSSNTVYSGMSERLHLQVLGHFVRDHSILLEISHGSYGERWDEAEKVLDEELKTLLTEKETNEIFPMITQYVSIVEDIAYSMGMKAGARLILSLTDKSAYDS